MQPGEVLHAVLKIAHVAEEVLGQLLHGLDGWGGGEGGAGGCVLEVWVVGDGRGGCGVAGDEGGDEEGEEEDGEGEDGEEVWVEADECVDCEEGEGV